MAGKEHHHIWRLLQRGFGQKRGSDFHVWVYGKNEKPRLRGTGNFGVEKYFYGAEGSDTDKKITKFENSIQSDIQDTRKKENGEVLDSDFCSSLIAHLEIRSQFLRSEVSNLMERLIASIRKNFGTAESARRLVLSHLQSNPAILEELLAQQLVPIGERSQAAEFLKIALEKAPQGVIESLFSSELDRLASSVMHIPDFMKDAHNKAILEISPQSERVKSLRGYNFKVRRVEHESLILPDTCCAFVGHKTVSPFSQPDQHFHSIIVPISAKVAILGQMKNAPQIQPKTMNRILAGCAYEAFIADANLIQFERLSSRISKYARLMSDREIKALFSLDKILTYVG